MSRFTIVRMICAGILLSVCFILSGCATSLPRQSYNREANAAVKRIRVLPMQETEMRTFVLHNPGYSFGLVGALIAEANQAPKTDWLRAQVRSEGFDYANAFRERLTQALQAKESTLLWPESLIQDPKNKVSRDRWGLHSRYQPSDEADAQLDLAFQFTGYLAAGVGDSSPYRPTVELTARLVSADGQRVLMSDQIVYNSVFPGSNGGITITPDASHAYEDFDAVRAAGKEAVAGLRKGFEAVADELARQL